MKTDQSALERFTRTAEVASNDVIGKYSTSFGLATRLLGRRHRRHIRNIYAMVRVADEMVDGVAAEAGLTHDEQHRVLGRYVDEVHRAMRTGYSSDLVIHAFALTARRVGIDQSLTEPFFASMRADLALPDSSKGEEAAGIALATSTVTYDATAHESYVYGSAEVVGLMCLRVFTHSNECADEERIRLEHAARQLGSAFQNVNFLRDLADDTFRLNRSYLGDNGPLDDRARDAWVSTVRAQMEDARSAIPLLPKDARIAVRTALALFAALVDRVERTPAVELYRRRIRVPNGVKVALTAGAILATMWERDS